MSAISCPVCNAPFRESLHDGILIDICTQCRGVWLDRGELEKLLSAVKDSSGHYSNTSSGSDRDRPPHAKEYRKEAQREDHRHRNHDDDDDDDDDRRHFNTSHPHDRDKYRKRSKLESLFGMFD